MTRKMLAIILTLALVATTGLVGCSSASNDTSTSEPAKTQSTETGAAEKQESKPAEAVSSKKDIDWSKYPDKPIKVIVAYGPGGGSDIMAMAVQPYAEKYLGTNFITEYKPGANGAVGWTYLANNTEADGFTIAVGNTPSIMAHPIMSAQEIKYTMDDFVPVYNVVEDPGVLVVKADSPFKTFEDFAKYAKEHPKSVTVAQSGIGGDDWVSVQKLIKDCKLELVSVPFEGDGASWQAALGGHVVASSNNLGNAYPQIKNGNLRALAVYAEKRSDLLPDVPTMKELGYNLVNGSGRGYIAKKGTPKEAIEKIAGAFEKAVKDPEFLKKAEEIGLPVEAMDIETYGKYLEQRTVDFAEVYKDVKK